MKPDKMDDGSWRYGDAGDRFPVAPGDVFASGGHIVGCADLERGAVDEFLETYCKSGPDCVYTDPPWNAGNATSFRTKAGVKKQVDFPAFLAHVVRVVRRSLGLVWIETTVKQTPRMQLRNALADAGECKLRKFGVTYYKKHPSVLFLIAFGAHEFGLIDSPSLNVLEGMDDDYTPKVAIEFSSRVGQSVFDPCTGRGLTCRTAHDLGRRFVGTELHPRRLACVLAWLKDKHGHSPEKIGELKTMKGA